MAQIHFKSKVFATGRTNSMHRPAEELLATFAAEEKLPASYPAMAERWFLPLAEELYVTIARGEVRLVGIVGSQGSGKSTLARLLALLLSQVHGLRVAEVSLDDFYLTRAERRRLAQQIHPLLMTRGVPGTHDLTLALRTVDTLLADAGPARVPRFDKARDERKPESEWDRVSTPVDAVLLEGWCVGVGPQPDADLAAPINSLEESEDTEGRWRGYVNHCLQQRYSALFELIDKLILLQAPGFDCVYNWRRQQEQKLAAVSTGGQIMSDQQLQYFVQHFERVTRHALETLPNKADVVFALDAQQQIVERHDNPASVEDRSRFNPCHHD